MHIPNASVGMSARIQRHPPSSLAARLFTVARRHGEPITSGMLCLQLNTAWAVWAAARPCSLFEFQFWTTYDAVKFGGLAATMGWAFDYAIACWPTSCSRSSEPPPYEGAMCYDYVPDACFDTDCHLCNPGGRDRCLCYPATASPAALMRTLKRSQRV